jgi:hypothetical protein
MMPASIAAAAGQRSANRRTNVAANPTCSVRAMKGDGEDRQQ